jgi:hypothetical protein
MHDIPRNMKHRCAIGSTFVGLGIEEHYVHLYTVTANYANCGVTTSVALSALSKRYGLGDQRIDVMTPRGSLKVAHPHTDTKTRKH